MNDAGVQLDLYEHLVAAGQPGSCVPTLLGEAAQVCYIEQGHIDLFLLARGEGDAHRARHHVLRAGAGQLMCLPGVAAGGAYAALMVPSLDAFYHGIDSAACSALLLASHWAHASAEVLQQTMRLIASVSHSGAPAHGTAMHCQGPLAVDERRQAFYAPADNCWVTLAQGEAWLLDRVPLPPGCCLPMPASLWLSAAPGSVLQCQGAEHLPRARLVSGFQELMGLLLDYRYDRIVDNEAQELARVARRADIDQTILHGALGEFAAILGTRHKTVVAGGSGDRLLDACRLVGQPQNIQFKAPPPMSEGAAGRDPVQDITNVSGVKSRLVVLEDSWWEKDAGPLLAFDGETRQAFALLPAGKNAYQAVNPESGERIAVDAAFAGTLARMGYMFYRALPQRKLSARDVIAFSLFGLKPDLLTVALVGLASGILGMAIPVATGHLFENIFPAADSVQMWQIITLLFIASAVALLFNATRAFAMLRIESKAGNDLQAAIWDRVLGLPVPFFRAYKAGDLAMRINGINEIRSVLSGSFIATLLSSLFSILNVALLFYYSVQLAFAAVGLVTLAVLVNLGIGYMKVRISRDASELEGRVSALVFEYLSAIAKLRTTGAEWRVFKNWASLFALQKRMNLRMGKLNNASLVFASVFPLLCNITIFGMIYAVFYRTRISAFSTGEFIAFNAAFLVFLNASLALVRSGMQLLEIVPIYERTLPILHTVPESNSERPHPGELNGAIELSNISFAYGPGMPLILDDVSLSIKAGQYVALVGASGSGKSTLLRLMLGFERPQQGGVYYDGRNIDDVDIGAVRRQLGVVLQGGQLMDGDIFSNIIGSTPLLLADAWEAARACGLDKDIENMAMGMHTRVGSGGGTLSGGQRQRLLIARAIVRKPRIIYFDEATSALDNQTQAVVSGSIEKLRATRVVIAHRLSTIINADCIHVLDKGKIVQSGTYQELMQQDGLFVELAKRQIA
ncbi:NHLP bacteriocin export ABC transporter permease/ATPase subunit [Massilia sp. TSP1-1-2]|uniref:NHLP bacteriocin export ABC transporter permease/ATPase subunit n=1 Tax=unclassified Massilia TaxID=2609279 RepID=UPI003CF61BFB